MDLVLLLTKISKIMETRCVSELLQKAIKQMVRDAWREAEAEG